MNELIPISQIADELGMGKSNARKYALSRGFVFTRARMLTGPGRKMVITLPKNEVRRLIALRKAEGFPVKDEPEKVRAIES